ncbi:YbhB/YbcL family Raf kinase inhibitor-like protein [Trinickia dabaoshanensis]
MRSSANGAALLACVFAAGLAAGAGRAAAQGAFSLTSTDLKDGAAFGKAQVYDRNDCTGRNVSPELSWRNAPAGTKSFAVTVFDIDAPGPGWWHWAVAAIPPSVTALPANASASGYLTKIGAVQARNDWGDEGYGGPCPPPGKLHRYVVTVFALNTADLRLGPGRHALMFDHEINTAALAKASLTVTYQR